MADFVIDINVRADEGKPKSERGLEQTVPANDGGASQPPAPKKMAAANDEAADSDLAAGAVGALAYGYLSRNAKQIVSSRLTTIGVTYSDSALQARINNGVQVATGIADQVAGAAVAASIAGPFGVALYMINELATFGMDVYSKTVEWNAERLEEMRANTRSAERLGVVAANGNRRNY